MAFPAKKSEETNAMRR